MTKELACSGIAPQSCQVLCFAGGCSAGYIFSKGDAHDYAGTIDAKAELEAINKMILELKNNLVTMNIDDSASANAPQVSPRHVMLRAVKKCVT